jgi:hypothetical protein
MKFDLPMLCSTEYQSAAEYSAKMTTKGEVMTRRDGVGFGKVLSIKVCFGYASSVHSEDNEKRKKQT